MWPRKRRMAEADRKLAESEKRHRDGLRLAGEAHRATHALRQQVEPNHFTELLTAAIQRKRTT